MEREGRTRVRFLTNAHNKMFSLRHLFEGAMVRDHHNVRLVIIDSVYSRLRGVSTRFVQPTFSVFVPLPNYGLVKL